MEWEQIGARDESRLLEAMEDELRLLGALRLTLSRMDEATSSGDAEALDDAVYASHRLMQTLMEAQRRRVALVEIGELRPRAATRSFAVHEATARLIECGLAMDSEIRGRCAALTRASLPGSAGCLNGVVSASSA